MESTAQAHESSWHWPEYGAEFLGTACLVFFGLSAVVFDFAPDLPMSHWIPSASTRLLINGLLFAGSGSLVALSPLGRLSGAHINPSVSLAFWLGGKMRLCDFAAYVVAQMLGGMAGALALVFAWRGHAASVRNGMTLPGDGWPLWIVFDCEVFLTGLLVFLIFVFVSSHRLLRFTPLMNWLVVATMVWLEAPISGTSLNPARSFGPALMTGVWTAQWLYFVAPPLGGMLGLAAFHLFMPAWRCLVSGKLVHAPNYRSIFTPGQVRPGSAKPQGVRASIAFPAS
jgi:aquaporin Z